MGVMSKLGNLIDDAGNYIGQGVSKSWKKNKLNWVKDTLEETAGSKTAEDIARRAKADKLLHSSDIHDTAIDIRNIVGSGTSGAIAGSAGGAVIGGIAGGVDEDETFLGGMAKGAVAGGVLGATAGGITGAVTDNSRLFKGVAEKISTWGAGEGA